MGWMRKVGRAWRSTANGAKQAPDDVSRAARDITGRTGFMFSGAEEQVAKGSAAYMNSFDRRLPPSLHVSERDRVRASRVIPVSERCIEDWNDKPGA